MSDAEQLPPGLTRPALAGVEDDLYLAAIAMKPHATVATVSGLGLSWSPLRAQCSGRSQTGAEVWMARGRPSSCRGRCG